MAEGAERRRREPRSHGHCVARWLAYDPDSYRYHAEMRRKGLIMRVVCVTQLAHVRHEDLMRAIELFGGGVIPRLRDEDSLGPEAHA